MKKKNIKHFLIPGALGLMLVFQVQESYAEKEISVGHKLVEVTEPEKKEEGAKLELAEKKEKDLDKEEVKNIGNEEKEEIDNQTEKEEKQISTYAVTDPVDPSDSDNPTNKNSEDIKVEETEDPVFEGGSEEDFEKVVAGKEDPENKDKTGPAKEDSLENKTPIEDSNRYNHPYEDDEHNKNFQDHPIEEEHDYLKDDFVYEKGKELTEEEIAEEFESYKKNMSGYAKSKEWIRKLQEEKLVELKVKDFYEDSTRSDGETYRIYRGSEILDLKSIKLDDGTKVYSYEGFNISKNSDGTFTATNKDDNTSHTIASNEVLDDSSKYALYDKVNDKYYYLDKTDYDPKSNKIYSPEEISGIDNYQINKIYDKVLDDYIRNNNIEISEEDRAALSEYIAEFGYQDIYTNLTEDNGYISISPIGYAMQNEDGSYRYKFQIVEQALTSSDRGQTVRGMELLAPTFAKNVKFTLTGTQERSTDENGKETYKNKEVNVALPVTKIKDAYDENGDFIGGDMQLPYYDQVEGKDTYENAILKVDFGTRTASGPVTDRSNINTDLTDLFYDEGAVGGLDFDSYTLASSIHGPVAVEMEFDVDESIVRRSPNIGIYGQFLWKLSQEKGNIGSYEEGGQSILEYDWARVFDNGYYLGDHGSFGYGDDPYKLTNDDLNILLEYRKHNLNFINNPELNKPGTFDINGSYLNTKGSPTEYTGDKFNIGRNVGPYIDHYAYTFTLKANSEVEYMASSNKSSMADQAIQIANGYGRYGDVRTMIDKSFEQIYADYIEKNGTIENTEGFVSFDNIIRGKGGYIQDNGLTDIGGNRTQGRSGLDVTPIGPARQNEDGTWKYEFQISARAGAYTYGQNFSIVLPKFVKNTEFELIGTQRHSKGEDESKDSKELRDLLDKVSQMKYDNLLKAAKESNDEEKIRDLTENKDSIIKDIRKAARDNIDTHYYEDFAQAENIKVKLGKISYGDILKNPDYQDAIRKIIDLRTGHYKRSDEAEEDWSAQIKSAADKLKTIITPITYAENLDGKDSLDNVIIEATNDEEAKKLIGLDQDFSRLKVFGFNSEVYGLPVGLRVSFDVDDEIVRKTPNIAIDSRMAWATHWEGYFGSLDFGSIPISQLRETTLVDKDGNLVSKDDFDESKGHRKTQFRFIEYPEHIRRDRYDIHGLYDEPAVDVTAYSGFWNNISEDIEPTAMMRLNSRFHRYGYTTDGRKIFYHGLHLDDYADIAAAAPSEEDVRYLKDSREITIDKTWLNFDKEIDLPKEIKVSLVDENGKEKEVILSEANGYKANLLVEGDLGKYKIKEENVEGFTLIKNEEVLGYTFLDENGNDISKDMIFMLGDLDTNEGEELSFEDLLENTAIDEDGNKVGESYSEANTQKRNIIDKLIRNGYTLEHPLNNDKNGERTVYVEDGVIVVPRGIKVVARLKVDLVNQKLPVDRRVFIPSAPLLPSFEMIDAAPLEPAFEMIPAAPLEPAFEMIPAAPLEPSFEMIDAAPLEPSFEKIEAAPLEPSFEKIPATPLETAGKVTKAEELIPAIKTVKQEVKEEVKEEVIKEEKSEKTSKPAKSSTNPKTGITGLGSVVTLLATSLTALFAGRKKED